MDTHTHHLHSIVVDNHYVVIDCFFSLKYNNALVIILNNRKYIRTHTHIDIDNMEYYLNGTKMSFKTPDVKDFHHLNRKNYKHELFKTEFQIPILYAENAYTENNQHVLDVVIGEKQYTFSLNPPCSYYKDKKCITTIFKNEYHLIRKWVKYHKKIGFEKFILYDNNTDASSKHNLLIEKDQDITIINANWQYWGCETNNDRHTIGQCIQQNHCIWKYMPEFLALTDLDEYINPKNKYNLFNPRHPVLSIPNYFFTMNNADNFSLFDSIQRQYDMDDFNPEQRKCIVQSKQVDLFLVHLPISFTHIIYGRYDEVQLNHFFEMSAKSRPTHPDTQVVTDASIRENL